MMEIPPVLSTFTNMEVTNFGDLHVHFPNGMREGLPPFYLVVQVGYVF